MHATEHSPPRTPGGFPAATLRAALAAAGPRPGAALRAPDGATPLAALVGGTVLGPGREALRGASVLLTVSDQRRAAAAMVDLDGLVGRLVLCPPDLKPEFLAVVAAAADATVLVTDRDAVEGAPDCDLHRCDHPLEPLPPGGMPDGATEWVMLTSGTSGAPKLALHGLPALTGAIAPVRPDEPLVWGTFYDIRRYGGLQIFLRAVLAGCDLVLSAPEEPLAAHLARLNAAGVTHLSGTPSHWRRLLMSAETGAIRPGTIRLSGEIADQAVLDGLADTYPAASIGHAYASTEAGVVFHVEDGREGFPAALVEGEGPCALRVVDGVLRVRSPRAASRYLGEGAPPLADADGFVDTGDMVERRGDRLHFVGRRGGIINVGGLKVHPEEIEAVINRQSAVRISLVRSRRSPIMGAVVVAEVVLAPGAEPEAARAAIMAACRASLAVHKVPATLRFVPAVDVTPAGKLSRSAA